MWNTYFGKGKNFIPSLVISEDITEREMGGLQEEERIDFVLFISLLFLLIFFKEVISWFKIINWNGHISELEENEHCFYFCFLFN